MTHKPASDESIACPSFGAQLDLLSANLHTLKQSLDEQARNLEKLEKWNDQIDRQGEFRQSIVSAIDELLIDTIMKAQDNGGQTGNQTMLAIPMRKCQEGK